MILPGEPGEPGLVVADVERFLREAEIGRRVEHGSVVRTCDGGALAARGETHHFLAMEYVRGQTLRKLREELEQVPEEFRRQIGLEITKGLEAIHAAGAVHCRPKPENVLPTPDHVVRIMSLGLARQPGPGVGWASREGGRHAASEPG